MLYTSPGIHADMPIAGISGLPARPLTKATIQTLTSHPKIAFCHPIFQLESEPDAIVAISLGITDQTHLLIYNWNKKRWERMTTVDTVALTESAGLDSQAMQNQLKEYYDEEEVEPAGYPHDPMEGLAERLPQEPLSDDQLTEIRDRSFIVETIPLVRQRSDDHVITLFLVFEDLIEAQRIVGAYGYDTAENGWCLLNAIEEADADRDEVFDNLAVDITEWVTNAYQTKEIRLVEDPEYATSS